MNFMFQFVSCVDGSRSDHFIASMSELSEIIRKSERDPDSYFVLPLLQMPSDDESDCKVCMMPLISASSFLSLYPAEAA